jgi:pyrimidine-nucleoside phosphorylase/thymidine phosphorylase
MVIAQGGDPGFLEDPSLLPSPRRRLDLLARRSGHVQKLAARPVGHATMLLGAGRARVDSTIDHAVGVILHKKVGDPVREGEALCTLLVNDETRLGEASDLILGAFSIGEERVEPAPLIIKRIKM